MIVHSYTGTETYRLTKEDLNELIFATEKTEYPKKGLVEAAKVIKTVKLHVLKDNPQ